MSPAEKKKMAAIKTIRKIKKQIEAVPEKQRVVRLPVVVRTTESRILPGMHPVDNARYTIGYVISGTRKIYSDDSYEEVKAGEIFFLDRGSHYVEEVPAAKAPFEQVMFYYTSEQMARILASLSVDYGADLGVRHYCDNCLGKRHVIAHGWGALKHFFTAIRGQLAEGYFEHNPTAELVALTQLVYHIVSRPESCLRTTLLSGTDPEKELMEKLMNEYIFSNISLEELARKNNRSLSSLKIKFKEHFGGAPRRWITRKRLMHARLQILQTTRSIVQIGQDCCFPSTSHFIKLFRDEYGLTPREYRRKHLLEEEQKKRTPEPEPAEV